MAITQIPFKELSAEAQALHAKLKREWKITDSAGGVALLTLCQCLDRLRDAQRILKVDGIIITDRWGQKKAHPASTIEREARAGLLACLKSLNLDLESLEETD
jgi:P27 family predicted phage terminase small subunit